MKIRNGQRIYESIMSAWMPMTYALVRKPSFNTLTNAHDMFKAWAILLMGLGTNILMVGLNE
ncbi:MAG: hypothetical protein ACXACE_02720 [Candidatus Thorarchaeota archaeon]